MASNIGRKYALISSVLVLVIFSDQLTKFQFSSTCNPGIAFSFLQSLGRINILLSLAVIAGAAYYLIKQNTKLSISAVSLVLAGGLSNAADRIAFGCVRDFIDFGFWPSFNLADSAVVAGVVLIIINITFLDERISLMI